jgi:single-stranded-DNA-specific exonuclease
MREAGLAAREHGAADWVMPTVSPDAVERLRRDLSLERPVAAVLAGRGYRDPEAAQEFLFPSLDSLHDPLQMRDMDRAVARILDAIGRDERILIYGDYDVDGACSIVILKKAIEILGGRAEHYIPHRVREGYGMRMEIIEQAALDGVRLLVSVDTGIRASQVVQKAQQAGMDVIITDHHLPDAELPPALAVLNPNRPDCPYPNKHLCGAGVTLKLVEALFRNSGLTERRRQALLLSFLKPVAIATVADIVPLTGENRTIVQRGLSGLQSVRNIGLKSLLAVAGFAQGECPSAGQVAFRIAPRINAAGRMATAHEVVELLLTEDLERARILAGQLDAWNRERQQVEAEIIEAILQECKQASEVEEARALVFAGTGWHPGVLGIVASKLAERYCRPVFVLSEVASQVEGERLLSGSGRSIPSFHLLEALQSMPELFIRFGGHRQAAGVTLPFEHLPEFRRRFEQLAAERLTPEDLRPRYEVDAVVSFQELSEQTIRQLSLLGPFGFGNPVPLLYTCQAEVAGPVKVFKEGKHFAVPLRHEGRLLIAKAWNMASRTALLRPGAKVDVLFQVEDDAYSRKLGYGSWQISLRDIRTCVH